MSFFAYIVTLDFSYSYSAGSWNTRVWLDPRYSWNTSLSLVIDRCLNLLSLITPTAPFLGHHLFQEHVHSQHDHRNIYLLESVFSHWATSHDRNWYSWITCTIEQNLDYISTYLCNYYFCTELNYKQDFACTFMWLLIVKQLFNFLLFLPN